MSDLDALLARVHAREPGSRDELASALYGTLRRYFRRTSQPSEIDDLVQATLVVLVGRIDSFRPLFPGAFTVFAIKTADLVRRGHQTAFARAVARRPSSDRHSPSQIVASGPSPSTWVADRELLAAVDRLILELGSVDQRTLRALMDDESQHEQIEREGIRASSLRARLARALARLRNRARDAGLVPASSTG